MPEQDFFLQKAKDTKQKSRESESATHLSDKVRCCHICTKTTKCLQKEKVLRWSTIFLQKVKVIEQDYFTESKRDQNKQMFTESESAKPGFLQRQNKKEWKVKVPAHV